ncbi:MAG: PRD domain-containing protein [Eubacteriales bacterium]|nr:PRD domain-containing protein [Eubacteriales bacterium]
MKLEEDNRLAILLSYMEFKKAATLEELSDKLNVTTKTIRNDIKELNAMLEGSGVIENVGGKYRLFQLNSECFAKYRERIYDHDEYMNSPTKRYAYIMKRLLHSQKPYPTEELAYEMNVGRTTVIGDLKRLRAMLEGYHLSIKGQATQGLFLEGDEMYLRLFILENMYDAIYGEDELPEEMLQYIDALWDRYYLDAGTKRYFLRSFTLMIDRVGCGRSLENMEDKYRELLETNFYKFAQKIAREAERVMNLSLSRKEIVFLSLPIAGMRMTANEKGGHFIEITEEVAELVIDIMDRIAYEMNFHISPTDLLDEFVYHLNFMFNRLKYRVYIANPMLCDIQQKYPVAYKMAEVAKKVIEEQMNVEVIEEELGFMASYFSVFLEEQKVMGNPNYQVAVITESSMSTIKLMELQLKKILPDATTYVFYEKDEVNNRMLCRYDIVLSTERIDFHTDCPVVYLREIFDEVEISRKIEQIQFLNRGNIKVKAGLNSLIATLVEPETFFCLSSDLTFLEATEAMMERLMEKGMIDEKFRQAMLEREEKITMLFDENIGFPHIQYEGETLIFAMGVTGRGEKEPGLKLIFLLGLPKKKKYDDQILMKIYDEIISIAGNPRIAAGISLCKTGKEFYNYMIKHNMFFE